LQALQLGETRGLLKSEVLVMAAAPGMSPELKPPRGKRGASLYFDFVVIVVEHWLLSIGYWIFFLFILWNKK
jgi:hypothetical protein